MGSGYSQEHYDRIALDLYETASGRTCILPDVGLDESVLKYSGLNSSAALQVYSNELVNSVPGFVERLGSSLGSLNSIPNAVGLGALVISLIMEICMKSSTEPTEDSYSMFKRVFGEEKASSVQNRMSESVKRYRAFMNNNQRLWKELDRLELQLSQDLTNLINSLLHDNQMSSRGFKIWVNGAAFHLQMMIHEAWLKDQAGERSSDNVDSIKITIDMYLDDLDNLLKKYKTYHTSIASIHYFSYYGPGSVAIDSTCNLENTETKCKIKILSDGGCSYSDVLQGYVKNVFSKHEPITSLRNYFSNIKNNIDSHINQHVFPLKLTT
ncbi:uncharacterized protein LOC121891817 [Scomber scombrus]|uniref:Uncharacterized protein LOC121891817 n=1 Tax=Scomber scombrus TaxID=13677 RepID=A0AAV1Q6R5_SCOSC